jgi:hypothetical protein
MRATGLGPRRQPVAYGAFTSPVAAQLILAGWVGKRLFVNSDQKSGVAYNRMLFGLIDFWPHTIGYGESAWDGGSIISIVADYSFGLLPDEVRMLEDGVYLGYSLNRLDDNHAIVRWALDFHCPDEVALPWNDTYETD